MRLKFLVFTAILFLSASAALKAQTPNDVLNILINKGTITQSEADSIRADYAIKQQQAAAQARVFPLGSSRLLQLSGYTQVRSQFLSTKRQGGRF